MSLATRAAAFLRGIARRRAMESDMDAEMRAHIDAFIDDQLRSGVPQSLARRQARVEFGSLESLKDECREARGWRLLDETRQDLHYAARSLRKSPGFTAVAVLTLGIGLGANTAIFSAVDAWLLRPLPFPHPDRLAFVWSTQTKTGAASSVTPGDLDDFRRPNRVLEGIAACRKTTFTLSRDREPEQVDGARVSWDFFRVLGVTPALGRDFNTADDTAGAAPAAVISDALWRTRFNADPALAGATISLDGSTVTVIGILHADFQFTLLGRTDVWLPLALSSAQSRVRNGFATRVVARLKPGVTIAQARAFLAGLARHAEQAFPATNLNRGVDLENLRDTINEDIRSDALWIVFAVVGCVLLIACANVASLLFGRVANRAPEFALRLAIGAGRFRILRQVLAETALMFTISAVVAVGVAALGARALLALIPAEIRGYLPQFGRIPVDSAALAYAFAAALLAAIVFGFAPALQSLRLAPGAVIGSAGPRVAPGPARFRKILVAAEISLAAVVLIASGLLLKSMGRISALHPGFDTTHLLTARVALSPPEYVDDARIQAFYARALDHVRQLPGVRAAGAAQYIPFGLVNGTAAFRADGAPAPLPGEARVAEIASVTPGYFSALSLPLVRGRAVDNRDVAAALPVAVVNETLVRTLWPGLDPLGRRLRIGARPAPFTVVGVCRDVKLVDLREPREPQIYVASGQVAASAMTFAVRTEGDPVLLAPALRRALAAVDPTQALFDVQPMDRRLETSHIASTVATRVLSLFAAIALFLSAIGVYGVISYSVAARRREIGVRMALGAARRDVVLMVLRQGLRLAGWGLAAGLACAAVVSGAMSALLFQVSPRDGATFGLAGGLLAAVALAACYLPARRAAGIDPAITLRYE